MHINVAAIRVACVAGRKKGGRKVKMSAGGRKVPYRNPPESDLLALHWLLFPLSLPFGRLPHRLPFAKRVNSVQSNLLCK